MIKCYRRSGRSVFRQIQTVYLILSRCDVPFFLPASCFKLGSTKILNFEDPRAYMNLSIRCSRRCFQSSKSYHAGTSGKTPSTNNPTSASRSYTAFYARSDSPNHHLCLASASFSYRQTMTPIEVIPPAPQPVHFVEWFPLDLVNDPKAYPPIIVWRKEKTLFHHRDESK